MTIAIESLTFEAILGLLPHERRTPQRIVADCRIGYTFQNGNGYVDYAAVASLIRETVQSGRFELIEEAIEAVLQAISTRNGEIAWVWLKICKPDILPDCRVCVEEKRQFL